MYLYCNVGIYISNLEYLWSIGKLQNFVNAIWCLLSKSWGSDFYANVSLYSIGKDVGSQELLQDRMSNTFDRQ